MNKRLVNILLLLILLVSLVSCASRTGQRAAPFDFGRVGDGFRGGLDRIEDFFTGGWQNYEKTVAFVVFFFLFFSAFLIGMKKAMGELTRAHKMFAFVAAFMSAFIIATTMRFDWVNLEYIAWGLIAVLVLFGIYSLLSKIGLGKHKFWAFLLALLIATLLLGLIWYLMNEGRPLSGFGRVSNWFGGLDGKAGVREGKELWPGGVPPVGRDEEVTPPVTPGKEGEKGWLGRNWWVIILVVALIGGVGGGMWKLRGAAGGLRRLSLRLRALKRKLREIINKTLRILRENPFENTRAKRKQVAQNLEQAIGTVEDIINRLEKQSEQQKSRLQKKQTKKTKI